MEGFTHVTSHRTRKVHNAAESARIISDARIPGAVWSDVPLSRSHLPGIPYSYYDDEIVMIRQRTAELVGRERAQRSNHYVPEGGQWYKLDKGHVHQTSAAQWKGVDE